MNGSSNYSLEEIVLTRNGEIYNPVDVRETIFLIVTKSICCLIGIPLNVTIAISIIRHRQLRCKPRNIFLLGIVLSYLSFFVPAIIELIYWGLLPIEWVCQGYVALVGVPRALLLMNMLLALVDRYVAINHPLLHRGKMTARLACASIVASSVFIVFSIKFVFIVGLGTIRCEMWLVHIKIITLILAILFVSCTALNVIVYRQTKTHLSDSRTLSPSSNDGGMDWTGERPIIIDGSVGNVRGSPGNSDNPSGTANAGPAMSIHVGRRIFSQMEIEATRTLIIGVASLIVTCLGVILASSFFICRFIFGQSECSNYNWTGPYLRELLLFPAVYFPIILILRSKELMLG
jgi:dopamine receptor D1